MEYNGCLAEHLCRGRVACNAEGQPLCHRQQAQQQRCSEPAVFSPAATCKRSIQHPQRCPATPSCSCQQQHCKSSAGVVHKQVPLCTYKRDLCALVWVQPPYNHKWLSRQECLHRSIVKQPFGKVMFVRQGRCHAGVRQRTGSYGRAVMRHVLGEATAEHAGAMRPPGIVSLPANIR